MYYMGSGPKHQKNSKSYGGNSQTSLGVRQNLSQQNFIPDGVNFSQQIASKGATGRKGSLPSSYVHPANVPQQSFQTSSISGGGQINQMIYAQNQNYQKQQKMMIQSKESQTQMSKQTGKVIKSHAKYFSQQNSPVSKHKNLYVPSAIGSSQGRLPIDHNAIQNSNNSVYSNNGLNTVEPSNFGTVQHVQQSSNERLPIKNSSYMKQSLPSQYIFTNSGYPVHQDQQMHKKFSNQSPMISQMAGNQTVSLGSNQTLQTLQSNLGSSKVKYNEAFLNIPIHENEESIPDSSMQRFFHNQSQIIDQSINFDEQKDKNGHKRMMSTQMQHRASTSNANHSSQMSKSGGFQNSKKQYPKKTNQPDLKTTANLGGKIIGTKQRPYKAQTRPNSNQKNKDGTVTSGIQVSSKFEITKPGQKKQTNLQQKKSEPKVQIMQKYFDMKKQNNEQPNTIKQVNSNKILYAVNQGQQQQYYDMHGISEQVDSKSQLSFSMKKQNFQDRAGVAQNNHMRINSQQQNYSINDHTQLFTEVKAPKYSMQQPKSQKSSTSRLNNSNIRASKNSVKTQQAVQNTGSTDRLMNKGVALITQESIGRQQLSQMSNYAPVQGGGMAKQTPQPSTYPYQSNSTKSGNKVQTSQERKNLSIAQIFQQKGLKYNGPSKLNIQQSNAQKMKNIMDQNGVILHPKSTLKGGALTTSANTAQNSPRVFNKNKNSMYQKNNQVIVSNGGSRKPSTASIPQHKNDFENQVQQTEVMYGGRDSTDAFQKMKEIEPSKISSRLSQNDFVSQKSYKNEKYQNTNLQAQLLDGGTGSNSNLVNKHRKTSVAYSQSGNQISVQLPGALQDNFYSNNQIQQQPLQNQQNQQIISKFVKNQPDKQTQQKIQKKNQNMLKNIVKEPKQQKEEFVFKDEIEYQQFDVDYNFPEGPLITEEEEQEIRQVASDINEKAFYGKILRTKQLIQTGTQDGLRKLSPRSQEIAYVMTEINKSFKNTEDAPETRLDYYRIGKMLGRGAFGKVNLAMHKLVRKLVALKSLNKECLTDEVQKQKLMKEVNLLLKLRHDHVVKIYETIETKKHIIIVMELCAGGDLLNYVRKRRRLKEPFAKKIFRQIIDGLKYIHSKFIAHRDIKLDNILLDGKGSVKIADFGVSKQIQAGVKMREQCGTPAYIAPEILKNKNGYTFNVDLWSAGVVLFAMLYGTVPFKAASMDELHSLILRGAYLLKDDISQEARDMLRGLLEINPHKRLTYDQIYNHPWLADYDDSLDLFNDQEREMIKKEYTYNDPSRFNRNENEDPIDCFTEHNIDSVYNTLKNCSEKSIILAPFNSTQSEDIETFKQQIKHMMIEKQVVLRLSRLCREIDRQYEFNNNGQLDNGVYHKQVNNSQENDPDKKEDKKEESDSDDEDEARFQVIQCTKSEGIEFLTEDHRQEKRNEQQFMKLNEMERKLIESTFGTNKEMEIDDVKVDKLVQFGYPKGYILQSLQDNDPNYCTAGYYLLKMDQNYC